MPSMALAQWKNDVLNGYVVQYVNQPDDYSGSVRCTVVRTTHKNDTNRGILYVHGFNDYFFNAEMGERFSSQGMNFYALDLRKYGRSIMEGQKKFECRDMEEYFADIDAALAIMQREGCKEIILMGHSTGGLLTSYYLAKGCGKQFNIKALILNSPFLEFNLSTMLRDYGVPTISWLGDWFPNITIPQGSSNLYSRSLLKRYSGDWDYNCDWKLEYSTDVTSGWIHAIHSAQIFLQEGTHKIKVPILLMHSDRSYNGSDWCIDCLRTDCVLSVDDIHKYGVRLGNHVTEMIVVGGLHDLFLTQPKVRYGLYPYVFNWIKKLDW